MEIKNTFWKNLSDDYGGARSRGKCRFGTAQDFFALTSNKSNPIIPLQHDSAA